MKRERTVKDFLDGLEKEGLTLADWARKRELPISAVYAVVGGRGLGRRGAPRKVMKEMGLPVPPMHRLPAGSARAIGGVA